MPKDLNPREVLEAPIVQEAFQLIRSNIKDRFINLQLDDVEGMKSLRYMAHAVDEFERFFRSALQAELMEENRDGGTNEPIRRDSTRGSGGRTEH